MNELETGYHVKQYQYIYRSTEVFVDWLENKGFLRGGGVKSCVLDMACGAGSNTMYMANRHDNIKFVGLDIDKECIDYGNIVKGQYSKYNNYELYVGDWFNLETKWRKKFDGIISFQTLFMFPDYQKALRQLIDLEPDWIAVSSLFYEGDIEYTNQFRDYYRSSGNQEYTDYYYNIHSMIRYRKFMGEMGYSNFIYMPFEIDIDIPKTDNMDIGTYTIRTVEGKRIQVSAGLMMPWYFVVSYK